MTIMSFLHVLRKCVISEWGDTDSIVRVEVDKDTGLDNVILIIVCNGIYQPIRIDPEDEYNQTLMDFCLNVFRETMKNPPVPEPCNHESDASFND